jgi:hypothetical protein
MTCVAFMLFVLAFVSAVPIHVARDVWVPKILTPTANTVWKIGSTYEVTWYVLISHQMFVV